MHSLKDGDLIPISFDPAAPVTLNHCTVSLTNIGGAGVGSFGGELVDIWWSTAER